MRNGGTQFVRLEHLTYPPPSAMATQFPQSAVKTRTPTKKKSNNCLKSIAKAIPGHLSPFIPGLDSSKAIETKNTTNELTTRAPGLEPHYDIEHFIPEDEEEYRGLLGNPLSSHNPDIFAIPPPHINLQRRNAALRKAVSFDTGSLIQACSQGQPVSITAKYVDTMRHREMVPRHMKQDSSAAELVGSLGCVELEAPTTKRPAVQVPRITVTPSSPAHVDDNVDAFDNTLLRAPPVCFKKKERKRQAKADRNRMLALLRRRSPSSFNRVELPGTELVGEQVGLQRSQNPRNFSNVDKSRRKRRNVKPPMVPFERYAYSLFG